MSNTYNERLAKLGCMVLQLFPKMMQLILKEYATPKGLKRKYSQKDFNFVLKANEVVLMDKLPNMDEFTIEICYKILRFENMLDEPKCKWGKVPNDTEIEIANDIQRLINATNSIISISVEDVTEDYTEKLLGKIKLMVARIDSFLEQDTLSRMFKRLSISEPDTISILQDLTRITKIEVADIHPDTESEKRERYSRLALAIIETFPDILRDVIRSNISGSQLYLQCIPYLNKFTSEQQLKLMELQYSNTYNSLDVTLIYRLLRQFSLIQPPTKGWGSIPDDVNTKLGDDVERIRYLRNQIAHRSDTNIDARVFDDYFDKFQNIGCRMDLLFFYKTNYEQRIIGHRTRRLDTEMLTKYENALKELENIQRKACYLP